MRIISGKYKGKAIKAVKGVRPTQNKVRKALFDILGDISGLSFLELFAGSGAVGFEALSLGASDLTLVEYDRDCLLAIKKNIETFKPRVCALFPQEAEKAIGVLYKEEKRFDIIFLDPPYYKGKALRLRSGLTATSLGDSLAKKALQILGAYDILAPNGFIVIQHFKKDELPRESGKLVLVKEARYGDTKLSFYSDKEG